MSNMSAKGLSGMTSFIPEYLPFIGLPLSLKIRSCYLINIVLNYEPSCMLILIYVKLPRGTSRGRTCDRFLAGLLLLFLSKEKYCLRSVYKYNKRQIKSLSN